MKRSMVLGGLIVLLSVQLYGLFDTLTDIGGKFLEPAKRKGEEILKPVTTKVKEVQAGVEKGVTLFDETAGEQLRKQFSNHPYGKASASVRIGTSLGGQERQYLQMRAPIVKRALEQFLGTSLQDNEVPRIAFCGSGGGYRAMLNTLGALQGAQRIGLLQGTTYVAGLSGSTWAIAPWMQLGVSLDQLKARLAQQLLNKFENAPLNMVSLSQYLLAKFAFKQPLNLVDIYGALLASNLLGITDPSKISLVDQASRVTQAQVPFPIYTAIVTKLPYEWVEFTPYEVGSNYLGGYVPTWAFGRLFRQGKSVDFAPPLSLGYLMGIWGSAFAANFKEILENFKNKIQPTFLQNLIMQGTEETVIGKQRLLPGKVFNYTFGMAGVPRSDQQILTLVDAGIDFNLPIPPLLRKERAIDLIVIFDASADGIITGKELQKAETYFKRGGIKLPPIRYEGIGTRVCSVFEDPSDATVPTIVYMPQIKNPKYSAAFDPAQCLPNFCGTFNFVYKPAEINQLTGLSEFNMQDCKATIAEALKRKIVAKRKR